MPDHANYVRREIILGGVINAVLSLVFFLAVFGWQDATVAGIGGYAFDFLPQSFVVALMSTGVPGALTAARLRRGTVRPAGGGSRPPRSLLRRALVAAGLATFGGAVIAALLLLAGGGSIIPWLPALAAKIVYGGALGSTVVALTLPAALAGAPVRSRT